MAIIQDRNPIHSIWPPPVFLISSPLWDANVEVLLKGKPKGIDLKRNFLIHDFRIKMSKKLRNPLVHFHKRDISSNANTWTQSKLPLACSSYVRCTVANPDSMYRAFFSSPSHRSGLNSFASSPNISFDRFMLNALIPIDQPGGIVYPAIVIPSEGEYRGIWYTMLGWRRVASLITAWRYGRVWHPLYVISEPSCNSRS